MTTLHPATELSQPSAANDAAQLLVVLATAPEAEAPALAKQLVDERLAACVNLLPGARSIYRWNDELCNDTETLLLIKTSRAGFAALARRYTQLHSYDVPELLALDVADGHDPYLAWALGELQGSRGSARLAQLPR